MIWIANSAPDPWAEIWRLSSTGIGAMVSITAPARSCRTQCSRPAPTKASMSSTLTPSPEGSSMVCTRLSKAPGPPGRADRMLARAPSLGASKSAVESSPPSGPKRVIRSIRVSTATTTPSAADHAPARNWNSPGPSPLPPSVRRWLPPASKMRISPACPSATTKPPSASSATEAMRPKISSSGPSKAPIERTGSGATAAWTAPEGGLPTTATPAESVNRAGVVDGGSPPSPQAASGASATHDHAQVACMGGRSQGARPARRLPVVRDRSRRSPLIVQPARAHGPAPQPACPPCGPRSPACRARTARA